MGKRKENGGTNTTTETLDPTNVRGTEPTPETPQDYEFLVPFPLFFYWSQRSSPKIPLWKKNSSWFPSCNHDTTIAWSKNRLQSAPNLTGESLSAVFSQHFTTWDTACRLGFSSILTGLRVFVVVTQISNCIVQKSYINCDLSLLYRVFVNCTYTSIA